MIDERAEFAAYTGAVAYDAQNKQGQLLPGPVHADTPCSEGRAAANSYNSGPRLSVANR